MQNLIMDIQGAAMELQAELHAAKEEIRSLRDAALQRETVAFDRQVYWTGTSRDTVNEHGPYCTRCFDADGKLVRMKKHLLHEAFCSNCRTSYSVWPENYRPPQPARRTGY